MTIPKNIALIFKTFNLLEIKGIGSSVSIDSYYKMIGYAGLLIDQTGRLNQYSALDVSLTFLSFYYPRKLMKHLKKERKRRRLSTIFRKLISYLPGMTVCPLRLII